MGVSFDDAAANAAFAEKFGYQFPLLCDTERSAGLAYGACDSKDAEHARRLTFVIGIDGRIEQAIETKHPATQAEELLPTV